MTTQLDKLLELARSYRRAEEARQVAEYSDDHRVWGQERGFAFERMAQCCVEFEQQHAMTTGQLLSSIGELVLILDEMTSELLSVAATGQVLFLQERASRWMRKAAEAQAEEEP